MQIMIFQNELHYSNYINYLKGMEITELKPPIRMDFNSFLNIDFERAKIRVRDWRPKGKCPLCFWNKSQLILTGISIERNQFGRVMIKEEYHKCPHFIYVLKYIDSENKYKDERDKVISMRKQFQHIIYDWDNWVTHVKNLPVQINF